MYFDAFRRISTYDDGLQRITTYYDALRRTITYYDEACGSRARSPRKLFSFSIIADAWGDRPLFDVVSLEALGCFYLPLFVSVALLVLHNGSALSERPRDHKMRQTQQQAPGGHRKPREATGCHWDVF